MKSLYDQVTQNQLLKTKVNMLANSIDEASLLMLEINEELLTTEKDLEELEKSISRKILKLSRQAINIPMLKLVTDYKGETK